MHQAVIAADVIAMQNLVHEIETNVPALSQKLAQLVYNFDYDGSGSLIDSN